MKPLVKEYPSGTRLGMWTLPSLGFRWIRSTANCDIYYRDRTDEYARRDKTTGFTRFN